MGTYLEDFHKDDLVRIAEVDLVLSLVDETGDLVDDLLTAYLLVVPDVVANCILRPS
jgi:hypothetical protein